MKELKLFNTDKVALVDDEDYEKCSVRRWTLTTFGYAISRVSNEVWQRGYYITLHQFVINGLKTKGLIDHIDRNKLNCQKNNLRIADKRINGMNTPKRKGTSSKYRGVCWDKARGKWTAYLKLRFKKLNLGRYSCEIEAAIAHDDAAIIHNGPLAQLNFQLYAA